MIEAQKAVKIQIVEEGDTYCLTEDEARELRDKLNEALGEGIASAYYPAVYTHPWTYTLYPYSTGERISPSTMRLPSEDF